MSSYIHVGRKLKRRKASYIRVSRKLKQRTKNSTVNRIRSRWAGTRTPCLQRTTSHRNPSIRGDCGTHSRYPCQKRGPNVQDELTANETTHKNSRLEEREPRPTDDVTEHTDGLSTSWTGTETSTLMDWHRGTSRNMSAMGGLEIQIPVK